MKILATTALVGVALLQSTSGFAKSNLHHRYAAHHRVVHHYISYAQPPLEPSAPYYSNTFQQPPLPFVPYDPSAGSVVLRQTIRAQAEPGLASEIDSSAAQTASGGPVGGIPSRSGGR